MNLQEEKLLQQQYPWERSVHFADYNSILGYYQCQSCLEHAIPPNILDLACGDGLLTAAFSKHFERVVGVDASSTHVKAARRRLPSAEFHESLIEDFVTDEKFSTVLMLNVLEHVIDPVKALEKSRDFLKDDGILIVHVPNALAINRRIAVLMGTLTSCEELSPFDIEIAGHRRSYSMDSLKRDAVRAGLKITETGGIFFKMLSAAQMDWFLKNGLWEEGGFGWGRIGGPKKDWKAEFCGACYEIGKERPEDCNIIFVCCHKE